MIRDGGASAVGVSILHVGSSLPDETEPEPLQDGTYFARPQDGELGHGLGDFDFLGTDELALQRWVTVLQEHSNDFFEILL